MRSSKPMLRTKPAARVSFAPAPRGDEGAGALRSIHAKAVGLYLMSLSWSHLVTLTTERGMSEDRLVREFNQRFIRRLAVKTQRPVPYFYALERDHTSRKFPHLHGLIAGTEGLTTDQIRKVWPYGYSSASPYDHRQAGALYVSKNLLLDDDAYDFSRRRPTYRTDQNTAADRSFVESLMQGDQR